jgi:hypothetical protein
MEGNEDKFSENEASSVLDYLFQRDLIVAAPARTPDGDELPFLTYSLSSKGILLVEKSLIERKTSRSSLKSPQNKAKDFPEYLLFKDAAALAVLIKEEFQKEKGRVMRLLLMELTERGLLSIPPRSRRKLFRSMMAYWSSPIGTYQSVFDFKYSPHKHGAIKTKVAMRVDALLAKVGERENLSNNISCKQVNNC